MDIMLEVVAYKKKLAEMIEKLEAIFENSEYKKEFENFEKKYNEVATREKVCVVIAGEYSTGKSTIISALTGKNIEIDSDVKTKKATMYEYEGVNIIDTPGLLAGFDDHTRISKEEIKKADFIVYCITTELFTPSSLEEFIKILDNKYLDNKVILAVNKLGMEASKGQKERLYQIMGYYDGIMQAIEEKGRSFDRGLIKIFSASNYIKGKKMKNDAMIRDSYFTDFIDILNGHTEDIKGLNFRCVKQVELILDFLQHIKEDISKRNTSEQQRQKKLKREEYNKKILEREAIEKKKIKEEFLKKEDRLLEYVRHVYDDDKISNSEMKKHIEDVLQEVMEDIDKQTRGVCEELCEEIRSNEVLKEYEQPQMKLDVEIKRKKKKKYKESNMKRNSEAIQQGASKISNLAEPVEIGRKGFFRRKKVFSEIGGEGTKLNTIFSKVFGKHSIKVSSRVGKIASNIEKHPQVLKFGGMAIDTALYFGRIYSENKEIEERSLGVSSIEKNIKEIIRKQQKNISNNFSDAIKEILKKLNSSEVAVSDDKFEREIEESYIELKNLKEKL